ncbi:MAG: hypothetical protein IJ791_10775 [Lachnospiraceae bacterium]|nr:hypothetical protein [Lachnospiraceae bacterium]
MKKRLLTMVCMMVAMVIAMLMPVTAHAESGRDLYCLRNPQTGEYLYTIDPKEKANLEGTWHYEGVVCKMPATSSVPTYRLLNSANGQHLYTASDAEITKLVGEGWTKEGVAYYVDDAKTAPVYRLFNTSTGDHAFGSDATAADMEAKGWKREGVAFYALWANADLRYSVGGKTVAAAQTTAKKATGKWYDNFERHVWYDMGDYFFIITDSVEESLRYYGELYNSDTRPRADILEQRYPERGEATIGGMPAFAGVNGIEISATGRVPVFAGGEWRDYPNYAAVHFAWGDYDPW